ncbi:MAG: transketolase [Deltaproteobacteria bacterium]|nr:transketolase [Deltaproteobacteria bacterium]
MTPTELHRLAANTLRALAIDAINAADSGHPGAPMGMADIAVVLWTEMLRFDPTAPRWINRDRFVLSNGHASMLLYGLLHLAGFELSIDELKRFRQIGSKTPGHPEYGPTPGVETTTGPLGQGFSNGVGMAIGARLARGQFGGKGFEPIDHQIYGFCGDGCLMEGITSEAASIAGHLGLGELVYVYDDNRISIDGSTEITFTEDVEKRFLAYGWQVLRTDGHDPAAIRDALRAGRAERAKPTLIMARTHIGYGSPHRQDTAEAHGSPLGAEEAVATKEKLGWKYGPFEVPQEVRALFKATASAGQRAHAEWERDLSAWRSANPELGQAFDAFTGGRRPADLYRDVLKATGNEKTATRNASGKAINAIAAKLPWLVGGNADLAASTKALIKGSGYLSKKEAARNIAFGVREHAMGAIVNGLAVYGGFVPYGATFLTFSDYMRGSIRLAAVMKVRSLFIFTHDSIYLGEDGPTHQAVEHLWALRLIPGLDVWRPADGMETAMAWSYAVAEGEDHPHALCFTRQNVPPLAQADGFDPRTVWKGAYVLRDRPGAQVVLVATGSEVHVALEAAQTLEGQGVAARVVSMPSLERFLAQDAAYRSSVLPAGLPRVTLELGRTAPWASIAGLDGLCLGVDRFGESGPYEQLAEHFGMTPKRVAERVGAWWKARQG